MPKTPFQLHFSTILGQLQIFENFVNYKRTKKGEKIWEKVVNVHQEKLHQKQVQFFVTEDTAKHQNPLQVVHCLKDKSISKNV